MHLILPDLAATHSLGQRMASLLSGFPELRAFFFTGDLGMGKTTLISALVSSLPGGDMAEIASPSFNLCNIYPTTPPVAHFDLYRQKNGMADESLLDFLEGERHVVLVEWADRLPCYALPSVRLECALGLEGDARKVDFVPYGDAAADFVAALTAGRA